MLKISNVQIFNLEGAVLASGNAMRTEPLKDLSLKKYAEEFKRGLERCKKLTKAGFSDVSCHSNYLTGILVKFDVTYPQYWTPEAQRYHWFNIVTSSSKMHRLCKMNLEKCTNKYVSPRTIETEQSYIDAYNELLKHPEWSTYSYWDTTEEGIATFKTTHNREEALYWAFMVMLSNCPLGFELFEQVTTNYKQLQTMYYQRKNHRLKEDWQDEFCTNFVEKLPYFDELIKKQ